MNCRICEKKLNAYLDNEISRHDRLAVEKHLAECSTCRIKLESLQNLSNRLKELPRIEGDLSERNRLIAALHEKIDLEPVHKPTSSRLRFQKFAFSGAIIVVVLIIVVLMNKFPTQPEPPFGYVAPPNEKGFSAQEAMNEILIDRMVQIMALERVNASEYRIFAEPILGVYIAEPVPPLDVGNLPDTGDFPATSS